MPAKLDTFLFICRIVRTKHPIKPPGIRLIATSLDSHSESNFNGMTTILTEGEGEQREHSGLDQQGNIIKILELLDTPIDQARQWANISRQFSDQIIATL